MSQEIEIPQTVKQLYRDAILVAHCEEKPHRVLVCFGRTNVQAMDKAIKDFSGRYNLAIPQGDIVLAPDYVGFWLPTTMISHRHSNDEAVERKTIDAFWLEKITNKGALLSYSARDAREMERWLPYALDRAMVGKQEGFGLN